MAIQSSTFRLQRLVKTVKIFLFLAVLVSQVNVLTARALEESSTGGDQGMKCTPCMQSPPPPSPPPPSPPPPALPPPPPRPPKTKKTPTKYCPPPPSFIYFTGPPGNLYPVDSDFSGGPRASPAASLPILIGSGLLLILAF